MLGSWNQEIFKETYQANIIDWLNISDFMIENTILGRLVIVYIFLPKIRLIYKKLFPNVFVFFSGV